MLPRCVLECDCARDILAREDGGLIEGDRDSYIGWRLAVARHVSGVLLAKKVVVGLRHRKTLRLEPYLRFIICLLGPLSLVVDAELRLLRH